MDLLAAMKVFVLCVDEGTLKGAAEILDISPTMAGKHLKNLETHLGARLLHRTTRSQALTEFGQRYYKQSSDILALVAESEQQAHNLQLEPAGTVRLTAPVTFGSHALVPVLADLTILLAGRGEC